MENPICDSYEALNKTLPLSEKLQGLLMRKPRSAILRLLDSISAKEVVDVCCGSGCLSCRLSRSGIVVTSVDSSPTMLARVKKKRRAKHIVMADAANMPFYSEYDAALVWDSMRRSVKPGGMEGWLARNGQHVVSANYFSGGTLGVFAIRAHSFLPS